MNEFSRLIYIYFNNQVTDALTITRLALNIFKQNYYENLNIPNVSCDYIYVPLYCLKIKIKIKKNQRK